MFEHVFDPRLVACNQRWFDLGDGQLLNSICKVALKKKWIFMTSRGTHATEAKPHVAEFLEG